MERDTIKLDQLPMYPESFSSLDEVLNFLKVDKYKDGRPFRVNCWNYDNDNGPDESYGGVYLGIVVADEDSIGRLFTYIVKERYIPTTFRVSNPDWEMIEYRNSKLIAQFENLKKEFNNCIKESK